MMGRSDTNATISAMHIGTGLLAYAAVRAMEDGAQRARDLAEIDRVHAAGQRYVIAHRRQRQQAALVEAGAKKARLLALRQALHG